MLLATGRHGGCLLSLVVSAAAMIAALLGVYLLAGIPSAEAISTDAKIKFDDEWYKRAAEEMKKPPPGGAIYFRGKGAAFLGIPYAQPSNLSRAFALPGVIDGKKEYRKQHNTDFGPYCPQMRSFPGMPERTFYIGEQACLTLNVFHPPEPHNTSFLYPVYVLLHGGDGFLMSGTAREFGIQGLFQNLVTRGVLVVTVEYRLGTYGLFNFGSGGEGDSLRSLRDVIAALRWVNTYIDNWHGDKQAVTLGGWGGGACLVSWLVMAASNCSNGISDLFQQADVHSGGMTLCEQLLWSRVEKNASQQIATELCGAGVADGGNKAAVRDCITRECICASSDSKQRCREKTQKCVQAGQRVAIRLALPLAQMEPGDGDLFRYTTYTQNAILLGQREGIQALTPADKYPIRIMRSWTRDEFATLHTQYVLEHFRRSMPSGWEPRYDKQFLSDVFARITGLNQAERNASATFELLYTLYAHTYNISDNSSQLEWYKFYVLFFTHYLYTVPALYENIIWSSLGHEVFLYEFIDGSGPYLPDATAAKFNTRVAGHAADIAYVFMAEQYFKAGAHNALARHSRNESVLLGEWGLADSMGHMMADFIWWRPMKVAFTANRQFELYTTRIDRNAGFAVPVPVPLPNTTIFSSWVYEWYCNFLAQIGEEIEYVEECASYAPNR